MTTKPLSRIDGLIVLCLVLCSSPPAACVGQDQPAVAETPRVSIADEPKMVDPATLVPEALAARVTMNFQETSLRDMAKLIQEQQKIPVLLDQSALTEEGILPAEPVTDRSSDAPLYLLVNRLSSLGLAWYVEDNILHITTQIAAEDRITTESYNVADLLDAGYKLEDLGETIEKATSGPWQDIEGTGGEMQWLGDVQFVRQTEQVHREIAGLLAALRNHGRQTYTLDPPQHMLLREKLEQVVDVDFRDVALLRAIAELSEKSGADIRLDTRALREEGIRDRELVSLSLTNRKLSTVLRVLLSDLGLTWILRDGVLWITTTIRAEDDLKSAVYDVRDMCRNLNECHALADAILSQTSGPWNDVVGTGGDLVFAKSGTMVVRQTERGLHEVLDLLETYRQALRESKPRERDAVDPNEIVTRYYRIHAAIAQDLENLLPLLVEPNSWKSADNADAPGTVLKVSSEPELLSAQGRTVFTDVSGGAQSQNEALILSRAVLIIRQTRKAHDEVAEVIRRVEQGDAVPVEGFGGGIGGGMGGGGFGGFFSTR